MLQRLRDTIWRIPKGKVATYGDVAKAAGFPGAARQVVWALHNSKGGLPWHRVLGAGGHIRIPGQGGLEQRARLQSEGVAFRGSRVDMARHAYDFPKPKKTRAKPLPKPKPKPKPVNAKALTHLDDCVTITEHPTRAM
ncbi:MAG: MGMT family protein [Bryobacteraceae bacterium]